MGLRGPGAQRAKAAREAAQKSTRKLPWQKKGLTRLDRVLAFVEWLPVTKGPLTGQKIKLMDDQRQFIVDCYGPEAIEKEVTLGIKSAPRGNGKTGLAAPLALCHLVGPECERRGEIYAAAIDKKQAGLLFNEIEAILLQTPELVQHVNIVRFHKTIEVINPDHPGAGTRFEVLSSDARRGHGLSPTFWVYDELAQTKDQVLLENLMTAEGKRDRTFGLIISTQAATDDHILSQLIDDGLSGVDPATVVHLTACPDDDDSIDIFSEETIRKYNPAMAAGFLKYSVVKKQADKARRLPAFEPAYRNLRLNQRVDAKADSRIVTKPVWKACGGDVIHPDDLAGRKCYGGLDLSGKNDLTSLTLVFPDESEDPVYDVLAYFWTPQGSMEEGVRKDRERKLMQQWIDQGFIEAVPGATIRYRYMAKTIADLMNRFDIQTIGFDRWRIDDLKADLADEGLEELPLEPYGQGFKDMAPAVEQFAECALTGRIRHGDNPVLTACVANAITVSDPAGNMKIDKEKSNKAALLRIDGAVTLAMALGIAKRFEAENGPSVYEEEFYV